ncbi:MAG: hypothetical protein JOZ80_17545 [Acidobacteriaceae bacterium]|nr:hypothetical protein [Acidobacteriaceae bacterium]
MRRLIWVLVAVLPLCVFGFYFRKIQLVAAAAAQSSGRPRLENASVPANSPGMSVQVTNVAPPGTTLYWAKRGDSVVAVARHFLPQTSYLTSAELAQSMRTANGNFQGTYLKPGQTVIVPGILDAPIVEKTIPVARDFEVRAIYLTGLMAGSDHGLRIIRRWREVGGNAVVFDIKDSDGSVNIPFEHPLLGKHHTPIPDLPKFVRFLHSQDMHAIARVAIFRDERLVTSHPELAVKSHRTGQPWRENGKLVWTDSSQPKVQEYDIALAKKAAESGVDEVQFDYVRFPAEGDQKDASFVFQTAHPEWHRTDVITDFLKHAYAELHPTGVLLSLDVFGVMAWQRQVDLAHTGQDIVGMARYCDALSPMIYPSHFFGMDGYAHPGDAPEHFIGESMDRFQAITKGSGVVIRPWLQAFHWRTKTYSSEYIETQVRVAKEKGGIGFLFWNAANDYSKPYAAMPEMRSAGGKYFRGDELPGAAQARLGIAPAGVAGGTQR